MVNDKIDVSKRIIELLIQGLYVEEILGESTAELADSTPRIKEAPSNAGLKIKAAAAAIILVGAIGAATYALLKRK